MNNSNELSEYKGTTEAQQCCAFILTINVIYQLLPTCFN
ncbi:hypothetical protein GXM_04425 [Nostoc sphaeroides CCNUC1]|uniref:Uncharacterized protein n=1 Tax=Nostoc sphaeroides CCNUC1 TaxID=2653204 RepID=A0A5P8W2V3_9NOSO|nr:hypothetical protein GXM_04425 [Nostoc sphaeroides CCNUC1]